MKKKIVKVSEVTPIELKKFIMMGQAAQKAIDGKIMEALSAPVEKPKPVARTMGVVYQECMEQDTMEKMRAWFQKEAKIIAAAGNMSLRNAVKRLKENLGYFAGYDGVDALEYLYEWLGIVHPYFGTPSMMRKLSTQDMLDIGKAMGEAAQKGEKYPRYEQERGFNKPSNLQKIKPPVVQVEVKKVEVTFGKSAIENMKGEQYIVDAAGELKLLGWKCPSCNAKNDGALVRCYACKNWKPKK